MELRGMREYVSYVNKKVPVTVTLDPLLREWAEELVAAGKASSILGTRQLAFIALESLGANPAADVVRPRQRPPPQVSYLIS